MPTELETLIDIDRFGTQAIYGRVLSKNEVKRMRAAENVVNAYNSRKQSGDWAAWARDHKDMNRLLELGMMLNEHS